MNLLQRRRLKKMIRHRLHEANHAAAMREDVADPAEIQAVRDAARTLHDAWKARDLNAIQLAGNTLEDKISAIYPPRNRPKLRENVEVFVVAIAIAMAVRAYVVQPFKIPTGSMQPSLNGITVDAAAEKRWFDTFPLSIVPKILFGENYIEVRAKDSGTMQVVGLREDAGEYVVRIGSKLHRIHKDMQFQFDPRNLPTVAKGDLLATGRRKVGDHIFVNRLWYNFVRPERGEVFVFSTRDIVHPQIRPDTFYIKRLVGLPGESISLDPPYLVVDGERVEEPTPFHRLIHGEGYNGYSLVRSTREAPALLTRPSSTIELADDEYLPFGDNTHHSLDGRYFGGVTEEHIIGPAFFVYWPLGDHWGLIR
jgi:signal peptidase I